jgi:hypothetical protein
VSAIRTGVWEHEQVCSEQVDCPGQKGKEKSKMQVESREEDEKCFVMISI